MKIENMMVPLAQIVTCSADERASDVAGRMADAGIGCVVVVERRPASSGGAGVVAPVGIVTGRDFIKLVARRRDFDVPVSEIMTRGVGSIGAQRATSEAAELMANMKIHHLVVVGDDYRLLGLLSSLDVARESAADAAAWPWNREAALKFM